MNIFEKNKKIFEGVKKIFFVFYNLCYYSVELSVELSLLKKCYKMK